MTTALFDAGPPTAPKALDPTIAARVPAPLKAAVEAAATRRNVDRSVIIREALEAYLRIDRLVDNVAILHGGQGAARRNATATERLAALKVAPRVGSQRFRALAEFALAAERGLTADEVVVKLAPLPHNGVARRVTDLLQAGFIRERMIGEDIGNGTTDYRYVTRTTRAGAEAQVYAITTAGHRALEASRARSRANA